MGSQLLVSEKRRAPDETSLVFSSLSIKRIRRPTTILDEESYTSALSHIIARDFFPGLSETEAQREYLVALETGDNDWIDEAGRRVKEVVSSSDTCRTQTAVAKKIPAGQRQDSPTENERSSPPESIALGPGQAKSLQKPDISLSLSSFQARYTSEDNESFHQTLSRHNTKKAAKYAWQKKTNQLPSARQIAQAASQQRVIECSQRQAEHDSVRVGNCQVDKPLGESSPRVDPDIDPGPASVRRTRQEACNALMFSVCQDDITATNPLFQTRAESAAQQSNAPPKSIAYANTRLPTDQIVAKHQILERSGAFVKPTADFIPESPSLSEIENAITGGINSSALSTAATRTSVNGHETPRVNGYTFVDEEPTKAELALVVQKSKEVERLAILNSIFEADGADQPTNAGVPFVIAPQSRRESLHLRMVEKTMVEQRHRLAQTRLPHGSLKTPTGQTPKTSRIQISDPSVGHQSFHTLPGSATPAFAVQKSSGNLTPAARSLFERIERIPNRTNSRNESIIPFDGTRGIKSKKHDFTPVGIKFSH